MVGADVGDSSRGAERASAMWLPGSASGTLSAHAHMGLLVVALQRCTIDFMYFMAMQFYIGFFGLAAVAALGEQTSDASLEHTAASKGVMPGSASSAANTISGACSSHVSLEKIVDAIDLQKVARGFPRGVSKVKPVKAKRYMAMVVVAIGVSLYPFVLSGPPVSTASSLHKALQAQARRNFNSPTCGLEESGVEDWAVLVRARGRWHEKFANETWEGQALPATFGRRCFFIHVGAFVDAIDGSGHHLVIPMNNGTNDWRAAVLQRVRAAHPSLVPFVLSMRCTLNGKEVGAVCTRDDLEDATLRWRLPGLLGGGPKVKDVDVAKDVDMMNKEELMRYAKSALDVEIRQAGSDGKKNRYRAADDVKKDCKAVQARLCQLLQVNDPPEIPAAPSSSSWEEPLPLPSGASSEEEGVTTRQATRQKAGSLGIKQRGTKAQLLANIKDATSGQQTLASVWGKANVASQSDEQPALPAPDSGSDIIDASPVPQRLPGSASGQG